MKKRLKTVEAIKGWSLSGMYLVYTAIFWGYPFVWLIILALSKWNFLTPRKFIWFDNFIKLFQDELFWRVFINTFNFMLYFIPIVIGFSLLFALGLKRVRLFRTFFILAFLVANVSSGVSYSIIFQKLFAVNGPLNDLTRALFGVTIPWFSSPQLATLSIAIMVTWKFIGYYGLIFFSGLQAIPQSLYEAAELDGAGKWTKFFKITVPLLNPSIVMVLVLSLTLTFGIFTEPFLITGGGPMRTTYTFQMLIYSTAFQKINPGYASSLAIVVALLSYGCVLLTRKLVEREVELA
ncbi:MAG TPA: sugar ABC transporter permease [Mesotoga sp.]|jgi:multiple sugar transport system permease protein|nr:sugar ABC transporter permease [Mesotoga sp.]MDI9375591.1 sugar ABC transporter permease [Thermotogota bacterium]NLX34427.1 sugar ABC transporter permease [Thermotogaceae bacterium]MDD4041204.1 sugar ABC transporter permease [Mesotoga sp.]MDD5744275.1 sugar ABC transporter permease [Mesotoga sp.]